MEVQARFMMIKRIMNKFSPNEMMNLLSKKLIVFGLCLIVSLTSEAKIDLAKTLADAETGNIHSQLELVYYYDDERDYPSAMKWAQSVVDNPTTGWNDKRGIACDFLGCYAFNGQGMDKDYLKGLLLFEKAFEYGHKKSGNRLAKIFRTHPKLSNIQKAFYWYEKSADVGEYDSALFLGQLFEYGYVMDGTDVYRYENAAQDYEKSAKYYSIYLRKAQCGGYIPNPIPCDVALEYKIGMWYFNGENGLNKNYEMALNHFQWCVDHSINEHNQFKLISNLNDIQLGEAMWNISVCYRFGRGTGKNEITAFKWAKKAADKGNDKARKFLENY